MFAVCGVYVHVCVCVYVVYTYIYNLKVGGKRTATTIDTERTNERRSSRHVRDPSNASINILSANVSTVGFALVISADFTGESEETDNDKIVRNRGRMGGRAADPGRKRVSEVGQAA